MFFTVGVSAGDARGSAVKGEKEIEKKEDRVLAGNGARAGGRFTFGVSSGGRRARQVL